MTYAMEMGVVVGEAVAARASVPSTAPVVVLEKMTVPSGFTPPTTPVVVTEKVTFCPGCTCVRVAVNPSTTVAFVIVTGNPIDRLGAKVASPAYFANN